MNPYAELKLYVPIPFFNRSRCQRKKQSVSRVHTPYDWRIYPPTISLMYVLRPTVDKDYPMTQTVWGYTPTRTGHPGCLTVVGLDVGRGGSWVFRTTANGHVTPVVLRTHALPKTVSSPPVWRQSVSWAGDTVHVTHVLSYKVQRGRCFIRGGPRTVYLPHDSRPKTWCFSRPFTVF